jgi:hypothetical protein
MESGFIYFRELWNGTLKYNVKLSATSRQAGYLSSVGVKSCELKLPIRTGCGWWPGDTRAGPSRSATGHVSGVISLLVGGTWGAHGWDMQGSI